MKSRSSNFDNRLLLILLGGFLMMALGAALDQLVLHDTPKAVDVGVAMVSAIAVVVLSWRMNQLTSSMAESTRGMADLAREQHERNQARFEIVPEGFPFDGSRPQPRDPYRPIYVDGPPPRDRRLAITFDVLNSGWHDSAIAHASVIATTSSGQEECFDISELRRIACSNPVEGDALQPDLMVRSGDRLTFRGIIQLHDSFTGAGRTYHLEVAPVLGAPVCAIFAGTRLQDRVTATVRSEVTREP